LLLRTVSCDYSSHGIAAEWAGEVVGAIFQGMELSVGAEELTRLVEGVKFAGQGTLLKHRLQRGSINGEKVYRVQRYRALATGQS
jgi:hypothetical protein